MSGSHANWDDLSSRNERLVQLPERSLYPAEADTVPDGRALIETALSGRASSSAMLRLVASAA